MNLTISRRNKIIISDPLPLIFLSKMDLLNLLPAMYEYILITDIVWMETTRNAKTSKAAARILERDEELQANFPNRLIIEETPLGKGIKAIMEKEPNYRQRDVEEDSIIQWIRNASYEESFQELLPDILYENGKVPLLVSAFKLPVTTLNTSAFLQRAIDAGYSITLEKILKEMAESQVHFKLEHFVKHNDVTLDKIFS